MKSERMSNDPMCRVIAGCVVRAGVMSEVTSAPIWGSTVSEPT